MSQECPQRSLTTGRAAKDTDTRQIHFWVFCGRRFHPQNAIRNPLSPRFFNTRHGRPWSDWMSHPVYLHHDESQLRQRLSRRTRQTVWVRKIRADRRRFLNDRIFLARLEIRWPIDDAIDVRLLIARFEPRTARESASLSRRVPPNRPALAHTPAPHRNCAAVRQSEGGQHENIGPGNTRRPASTRSCGYRFPSSRR